MAFQHSIPDRDGWQTVSTEVEHANPHVEVHRVVVTSPSRSKPFAWTVCHRKAAVVVVPMTAKGELVLVREERVPIRRTIWSFPAGQIDDREEPDAIRATAVREMKEEAGYEPGPDSEIVSLGHFFPSPGFTDEHTHLLLVRAAVPSAGGATPEANEGILGCRTVSVTELQAMIASGEVGDANTLVAYARLVAMELL